METVIRKIADLDPVERSTLEHIVGHPLDEKQKLVIQVTNGQPSSQSIPTITNNDQLPDWCDIYEGLSPTEIADIEHSITRSASSREFSNQQ